MKRFVLGMTTVLATTVSVMPADSCAVKNSKVEVFLGAELHYRDIYFNKMYEVLVNLSPGVKWHLGRKWMFAAQALVPIYNDYGARYKKVRLNMAVLSKEWAWKRKNFLKVSGGLFGMERYGLDAKWMWTPAKWFATEAQVGWTGFCSMAAGWEASTMERFSALAGIRFYIPKYDTEFQIRGGRFLYEDNGVQAEAMRHFKHCTVGVYAQYTDVGGENGGFKVVVMIPQVKAGNKKVCIRPASNFRLTYNIEGQRMGAKMYPTDPEENEQDGWFDSEEMIWGPKGGRP